MIRTKPEQHQIEGVRFIATHRTAIAAAKTGKGKTYVILASIHAHVYGKKDYAVVFAPLKAHDKVWVQEVEKHTDMKIIKLEKAMPIWKANRSVDFLLDYDILLVKYPQVKSDNFEFLSAVMRGRILAYDEAHKLKNPDAQLVRLLTNLSRSARAKWAITATAVGNSIFDLWGIMFFLNPSILGTEWQFKKKYCVMEEKVIGWEKKFGRMVQKTALDIVGYKNLDQLKQITDQYMWQVESDLSVQFHDIPYELTADEDKLYLIAARGALDGNYGYTDNDGKFVKEKKGFAQRMPDIQRACDGSRDINNNVVTAERNSKYKAFLVEMKKVLDAGQSLIIFAEYLDTFEMLNKLLKEDLSVPLYRISSGYMEDAKEFPCVVLSTLGGSESLNLKFANHVFCYSIPFSVTGFVQLVGRITRMDSKYTEDLNVHMPYCATSIDKYKYQYLKSNATLINEVLGKDANLPEKQLVDMRQGLIDELRNELVWRIKQ